MGIQSIFEARKSTHTIVKILDPKVKDSFREKSTKMRNKGTFDTYGKNV
jgi:hypothetical protein